MVSRRQAFVLTTNWVTTCWGCTIMVSISPLYTELKCKEQQVSRLDLREDVFLLIPRKKCLFISEVESMRDGGWFTLLASRFTGYTLERVVSCGNLSFKRARTPACNVLGPLNESVNLRLCHLIQDSINWSVKASPSSTSILWCRRETRTWPWGI